MASSCLCDESDPFKNSRMEQEAERFLSARAYTFAGCEREKKKRRLAALEMTVWGGTG